MRISDEIGHNNEGINNRICSLICTMPALHKTNKDEVPNFSVVKEEFDANEINCAAWGSEWQNLVEACNIVNNVSQLGYIAV